MPTWDKTRRFDKDWASLSDAERELFRKAVEKFVADGRSGKFRKGLRVKGIQGKSGVFEMSWADDGRATFEYGPEVRPGLPHVIWRRIGTHAIFDRP